MIASGKTDIYSIDLSAATDRLPLKLQREIISHLFEDDDLGSLWYRLMKDYGYTFTPPGRKLPTGRIQYQVGQGMGLYSS
jgi:hypothetical protein